ncbi:MAG: PhzF family phenazine biosynthesis protein [Chloroflexi bacterium]|nr:PhzF family phenazine biosynthesis protein [Chloroflexota bacterium]MCY3581700.1 PhzF family phenazine biosynthesis protein [Chloroflexota bacterium]MCY3714985.1 PhzF family phenazine biosynthesis protein [Chloroflexota bacterium]MDE2651843.1 PhzF family phenazine biosynthesis protein [Chloroflexota bacterium]MXV93798.1 PhzF family phenazine biosynthesis protein [Chloroflexota bacterium]
MAQMEFFIVDVFTIGRKYTGNQLAVYLGNPPTALMQQLAKEINFSEITFVTSETPQNGGYNTRIFMPEVEVDFAGHPVLGTAYIIQRELIGAPVAELTLNLPIGQIPVAFGADDVLWMRQNPPRFGHQFSAEDLARVLNIDAADIDPRFPIIEVSTGLPFVLVPVVSLEALQRAWVNLDRLRALLGAHEAIGPAVFCRETIHDKNDIHVRVLDDIYGAPEDPATGSAGGCIAAYMLEYGYFAESELRLRAEQGYQIGRPSLLHLRAQREAGEMAIYVGGQVELVAQGRLAAD